MLEKIEASSFFPVSTNGNSFFPHLFFQKNSAAFFYSHGPYLFFLDSLALSFFALSQMLPFPNVSLSNLRLLPVFSRPQKIAFLFQSTPYLFTQHLIVMHCWALITEASMHKYPGPFSALDIRGLVGFFGPVILSRAFFCAVIRSRNTKTRWGKNTDEVVVWFTGPVVHLQKVTLLQLSTCLNEFSDCLFGKKNSEI